MKQSASLIALAMGLLAAASAPADAQELGKTTDVCNCPIGSDGLADLQACGLDNRRYSSDVIEQRAIGYQHLATLIDSTCYQDGMALGNDGHAYCKAVDKNYEILTRNDQQRITVVREIGEAMRDRHYVYDGDYQKTEFCNIAIGDQEIYFDARVSEMLKDAEQETLAISYPENSVNQTIEETEMAIKRILLILRSR